MFRLFYLQALPKRPRVIAFPDYGRRPGGAKRAVVTQTLPKREPLRSKALYPTVDCRPQGMRHQQYAYLAEGLRRFARTNPYTQWISKQFAPRLNYDENGCVILSERDFRRIVKSYCNVVVAYYATVCQFCSQLSSRNTTKAPSLSKFWQRDTIYRRTTGPL